MNPIVTELRAGCSRCTLGGRAWKPPDQEFATEYAPDGCAGGRLLGGVPLPAPGSGN